MRLVNKSESTENCSEIGLHNRCFLWDLSGDPLRDFDSISLTGTYPRGVKLFVEGQRPKGVFILCSGRAKLHIDSSNGRSIMRVAEQGEILGLSATLSGSPCENTAEMLEPGQVTHSTGSFPSLPEQMAWTRDGHTIAWRLARQRGHSAQRVKPVDQE